MVPTTTKIQHKLAPHKFALTSIVVQTAMQDVQFIVSSPGQVTLSSDEGLVAPFWYVETTDDQGSVNMALAVVKCDHCQIPVYRNIKPIQVGDVLAVAKGCEKGVSAVKEKAAPAGKEKAAPAGKEKAAPATKKPRKAA